MKKISWRKSAKQWSLILLNFYIFNVRKKYAEAREQLRQITDEFNNFKKEQEASPVTMVKN